MLNRISSNSVQNSFYPQVESPEDLKSREKNFKDRIFSAVKKGPHELEFFLSHTKDWDLADKLSSYRNERGHNLLTEAIRHFPNCVDGAFERLVKLLVSNRFNLDEPNEFGLTAIHIFAQNGGVKEIETLMEHGADLHCEVPPSAKASEGWSAIHFAIHHGEVRLFQWLVPRRVSPNHIIEAGPFQGLDLLCMAVWSEKPAFIKTLVKEGVDINRIIPSGAYRGENALALAIKKKHIEAVEAVVDAGADTETVISAGGKHEGWSPLHLAIWTVFPKAVNLLLSTGVDCNKPIIGGHPKGWSPLKVAMETAGRDKNYSSVEILLNADVDLNRFITWEMASDNWANVSILIEMASPKKFSSLDLTFLFMDPSTKDKLAAKTFKKDQVDATRKLGVRYLYAAEGASENKRMDDLAQMQTDFKSLSPDRRAQLLACLALSSVIECRDNVPHADYLFETFAMKDMPEQDRKYIHAKALEYIRSLERSELLSGPNGKKEIVEIAGDLKTVGKVPALTRKLMEILGHTYS
jgi:ankyrin repeat protein